MSVLRTQLSGIARRPSRLLLTGLAMIVASFVVHGTILAQQITTRTVLNRLSGTPAATDLVVGDGGALMTLDTLRKIRALPGVADAAGRVTASFELRAPTVSYFAVTADPGSGPLATVHLVSGAYPHAPHEIAVTRRTADRLGLAVGGVATVQPGGERAEPVTLKVTGLVDAAHDDGTDAFTTDEIAATLSQQAGFQQVEVHLGSAGSVEAVRAVVGPSVPIRTGASVRQEEAEVAAGRVKEVFALIDVFVAVAVAAAALVATSTFRIVFAQRMRQLALLRAVGAGRGAVARALAVEGVLTGLVAGVVGVLFAYGLGRALPVVLHEFGVEVGAPGIQVGAAVAVVAGTAMVTALAVGAPAFSAARVAPLEALRSASLTSGRGGIGAVRAVFGGLLASGAVLVAAIVVLGLPGPHQRNYDPTPELLGVVLSGTLAFFALVSLGPVLLRPVLHALGWPLRRAGTLGRLAVGGVGAAPRRAAAVSVVVALGVALIAGVLVLGASLRGLAQVEIAATAPADFRLGADVDQPLPPDLAERVRARAELTDVATYRTATTQIASSKLVLTVIDLDVRKLAAWKQLGATDGSLDDLGPGRVVLKRSIADDAGLRPGDSLTLLHAGRAVGVRVAATVEATPLNTQILADPTDLNRLAVPAAATGLVANAARPGEAGRTAAQKALRAVANGTNGLALDVLADQRDEINSKIDALVGIALGLMGLTVLIAVVGVGSTAALSVVERVREAGLLRAVGLSRGGLRAMLTTEAALYGVIGSAIGLVLAVPYAWLSLATLGEHVPLKLPVGQLALTVLVLSALTALAGVLPARRAAKVSPMTAIATDG